MTSILLEKRDYYLVAGGILASPAAGFVVASVPQRARAIDLITNFVPSLVMLVGLVFIFLGRRHYAGQIARSLELVGVATAILMVSWIPHFVWHVMGMDPMLSVSPGFWLAFFHVLTAGAFFIYLYGFYLFYRAGKPSVERPPASSGAEEPESEEYPHEV